MKMKTWESVVIAGLATQSGMVSEGELREIIVNKFTPRVVLQWAWAQLWDGFGVSCKGDIIERAREANKDGSHQGFYDGIARELEARGIPCQDPHWWLDTAPPILEDRAGFDEAPIVAHGWETWSPENEDPENCG